MISANVISDLKSQHAGRKLQLATVTLPDEQETRVDVVLAAPTRKEWQKFTDEVMNPDKRSTAVERSVRAAIKYPEPAELDRLASEWPGIFQSLSETVSEMAGSGLKVESKSL